MTKQIESIDKYIDYMSMIGKKIERLRITSKQNDDLRKAGKHKEPWVATEYKGYPVDVV